MLVFWEKKGVWAVSILKGSSNQRDLASLKIMIGYRTVGYQTGKGSTTHVRGPSDSPSSSVGQSSIRQTVSINCVSSTEIWSSNFEYSAINFFRTSRYSHLRFCGGE